MARFRSFHGTPILFLTVQVRAGLTLPARTAAAMILRDVWLRLTWRDGWFVGPYWIMPDRVSLFACAAPAACTAGVWTTRWKVDAGNRLARQAGGPRVEWAGNAPPVPMVSERDYRDALEALTAEAALVPDGMAGASASGMLWQLL